VVATSHHNQWTYDTNGNLLTATDDTGATNLYTYTAGTGRDPKTINAIQQMGATGQPATSVVNYGYDNSGDVTSIANGIDPTNPQLKGAVNQSVRYDAVGRPVRVTTYDHNIPTTISLSYDAGGERSDYRIQQASTGLNQDFQFGYRGDGELAQVTVLTGGVPLYTDSYLYGPTGEPLELLRQRPGGSLSRYWYVLDGQGSVVALTDANGTVVDRYAYDQWGELTSNDATDEHVAQQLRYRGYWYDEKLSWYWLGMRYYDPETARMLQPDPLDLDGAHTYAYADDNPTDEYDLLGLFDCPTHGIWFVPFSGHALHRACVYLDQVLLPEIGLKGGIDQLAGVVGGVGGAVVGTYNAFIGDDVATLRNPSASGEDKALALASLLLTVIPESKVAKLLKFVGKIPFAAKVIAKLVDVIALAAHDHLPPGVANRVVQLLEQGRAALGIGVACAACFAAGTLVAVPGGMQPIQALHVGDTVLAENPATGVVEAEPVQAVIQDPVSPLLAVQLSDGSAITVTADHPFWVDSGAIFKGPNWLAAGQLLPGDRLRTAQGTDVTVAGVRRGVGQAVVYTLTVATEHTFFVGTARVLVHNARCALHHVLPQRFRPYFASKGIDIDKFTIAVDDTVPGLHKQLHRATGVASPGVRGGMWNYEWKQWIDAHPNATKDEIFRQAAKLIVQYGIYGPLEDY